MIPNISDYSLAVVIIIVIVVVIIVPIIIPLDFDPSCFLIVLIWQNDYLLLMRDSRRFSI